MPGGLHGGQAQGWGRSLPAKVAANAGVALTVAAGIGFGARVVGACGFGPVRELVIEVRQVLGGIGGIGHRVKHGFNALEMLAVPFVVDLETADIKAARAGVIAFHHIGVGLLAGVKPEAAALHVHGPRPWHEAALAGATGFGERDGVERIRRYAAVAAGSGAGGIANGRDVWVDGGGAQRERQKPRQKQGQQQVPALSKDHSRILPNSDAWAGLGGFGYERVREAPLVGDSARAWVGARGGNILRGSKKVETGF